MRAHPTRRFNGAALREKRLERALSLHAVAVALRVAVSQVAAWEYGQREPSEVNHAKLIALLKCKRTALLL